MFSGILMKKALFALGVCVLNVIKHTNKII